MGLLDIVRIARKLIELIIELPITSPEDIKIEMIDRGDAKIDYKIDNNDNNSNNVIKTARIDIDRYYNGTFIKKLWNIFTGNYIRRLYYFSTIETRYPPKSIPIYSWLPIIKSGYDTSWELTMKSIPAKEDVNNQKLFAQKPDYDFVTCCGTWYLYFNQISFVDLPEIKVTLEYRLVKLEFRNRYLFATYRLSQKSKI